MKIFNYTYIEMKETRLTPKLMITESSMNQAIKPLGKFKHQSGFTLIELIMVIVILGILSAFALPKFADFSDDAEASSLEGARGAVRSASAISHAACLADSGCDASTTGATSSIVLEGATVNMIYGYPSKDGIQAAADLDGYIIVPGAAADPLIIAVEGDGTPCFTYSIAVLAGTSPNQTITAPVVSAPLTYNATAASCT
jgi:MSHA pilin protein MshA